MIAFIPIVSIVYLVMESIGKVVLIELEYGKYFVHFTQQLEITVESILPELDTIWFRAFPIVKIGRIIENVSDSDIDTHTIQFMKEYGISNVRSDNYTCYRTDYYSLDPKVYRSILEKMLGEKEARRIYSDMHDSKYNMKENSPVMYEKYENSPVMDVKYYNTVGRCECCLKKDEHIENCCYVYIRPLPHPEK